MREMAHNSAGFAAEGVRWPAAAAGALQAARGTPAPGRTDLTDRIACGDGGAAAALCQRIFEVIRRSCRINFMSDKVRLSDAIRKPPNAGRVTPV